MLSKLKARVVSGVMGVSGDLGSIYKFEFKYFHFINYFMKFTSPGTVIAIHGSLLNNFLETLSATAKRALQYEL